MAKARKSARRYVRSVIDSVDAGPNGGRRRRATDQHRGFKLTTVLAIATLLSIIGPYVSSFLGGYERADHARQEIKKVYEAIGAMARALQWQSVASIKSQQQIAENRATECDIKRSHGDVMSTLEMQACANWKADAVDAQRRYAEAYTDANKMSRPPSATPAPVAPKDDQ